MIDLRQTIRTIVRGYLVESTNNNKIFYHGSNMVIRQKDLESKVMYFTDNYDEAVGYSVNKHNISNPNVISANLIMTNILRDKKILHLIAEKKGYNVYDYFSEAELVEQPGIVDELEKLGYDSAIFSDFGFLSDFEEFDAYIVFNAKKQVKIIVDDLLQNQNN